MPRRMRPNVSALLVFALALGCTDRRSAAVEYATRHSDELVTSTRAGWTKYKALADRDMPPSEYPPTVRALHPTKVLASEHGLTIFVYTAYAHVTGVFIRHDPTFVAPGQAPPTPDSDDLRYERLAPDVYWVSRPR